MKARLLVDGGTPKVPPSELVRIVSRAGIEAADYEADFGIVVGGDGRFSYYGRTEDIPLLFVGVRSRGAAGSKAFLAQTTFNELPKALRRIAGGDYGVDVHPRLAVHVNGKPVGEVFTDVYLQRGGDSNCIRYRVRVRGGRLDFEEAAIGDGVVVATRAGATGYYSYPDRVRGAWMEPTAFSTIRKGEIGVCHITPTFTERPGKKKHPLRYTVPWGTTIEVSLFREADARLYGVSDEREGISVGLHDRITVVPGEGTTKVISFGTRSR